MAQPTKIGEKATTFSKPLETQNEMVIVGETKITSQDNQAFVFPQGMKVEFLPEQLTRLREKLGKVDFSTIKAQDIVLLAGESEKNLHATLDSFLVKIDQANSPRIFTLVSELSQAIDKEKLPDLADKIMTQKLGFIATLRGKLNPKYLSKASQDSFKEMKRLLSGTTKTLKDVIEKMEKELKQEQENLKLKINDLEGLKKSYVNHYDNYLLDSVFLLTFLQHARQYVEEFEKSIDPKDPVKQMELSELKNKLQALESRAGAMEGAMTRIPSDQLVIQQLQNAGIGTLQETATTAGLRFGSIKMTLITLHSALQTQGVQNLAQQGANLDSNLTNVRDKVMRQVVTTAANAPGDNRLAQAQQIRGIVQNTKELQQISDKAYEDNQVKFGQARSLLAEARDEMLKQNNTMKFS